MYTFRCTIAAKSGDIIEKRIKATSRDSLVKSIEAEGNFVVKICRDGVFFDVTKKGISYRNFKTRDFLVFNQEFCVLVKAGLSVVKALDAILEKENKSELAEIIKKIRDDIASGESVSGAFGKYEDKFPGFYIASLKAGEKSGNIPLSISRYIAYMKKTARIREKIVSASVYPLILTVISCFVLFFLLFYVVPSLTGAFIESGTQLPLLTSILIDFCHGLRTSFIYIFLFTLSLAVGFIYFLKTDRGRIYLDRWKLKIPFLGELYLNYSVSKFALTVATVLGGGIPLVETVRISSGALNNTFLKQNFENVISNIESGKEFSESLGSAKNFPSLAIRMISAGESGGALEQVLTDLAEFYENDVDSKLSILTSSIEPALMVIMGILIGFIVLAMYLPVFQMASTM